MKSILIVTTVLGLVLGGTSACRRADESAGSSTPSGRAGWPTELIFAIGVNPDDHEEVLKNTQLIQRIEQATGIPVKFFNATSFSIVVEAMRAKRIHGMQVGVFSYLLAEQLAGAEPVAVYVSSYAEPAAYDPSLRPEYNGIIVVKKGNGVRSLTDLKGRVFNFGDPAGTSDHLVPRTELTRAGVIPDRDVRTRFAGNHASALVSLFNGHADAAATAEPAILRLARSGQIDYCGFPTHEVGLVQSPARLQAVFDACPDGRLVAIHSVAIPGTPFALRGDLPADLKATIRASLLSTPEDPEFIRTARRWYVDPSIELKLPNLFAYFDSTREMGKLLDLDLRRIK